MADSSLSDVNYGRPGLTAYDIDHREWSLSRQPTSERFQQVADWQLVFSHATDFVFPGSSPNGTTARKDARRLTHDHPQLAPATKYLAELNAVSEAITSSAATYDPHVGDLLSFGTVYLKKFARPKRIVALSAGPSGNILRLAVLGQQRQGWADDRSVWLSGPSLKDVDCGYWNEEAAPIQQVCFAQTESVNSFLAVRLPSRTVLFRPSYHRGRQAAKPSPHYNLPPSFISANPIFDITLDQTGGVPHADVAFNPDYQHQYGVIDQQYNWSVWQIESRVKRDEYSVSRLIGGAILPSERVDDGDGWARLLWAGDSNTLVVCNRRQLSLISLNGSTFEYLLAPPVVPQRSTDWILDIKKHPQHHDRFLVLTTSRLFVVAVTTSGAAVGGGLAGATILFSRRHYRGDEDLTLQLSVQMLVNDEVCIFLASRLNKLVQTYHIQNHSSGVPSDPVVFDVVVPAATNAANMHLQPLVYGSREHTYGPRNYAAHAYMEEAVPFYQLTFVSADLDVYQTVLLQSIGIDPNPELITWSKTVVPSYNLAAAEDDFMEPNNWGSACEAKMKSQAPGLLLSDQNPPDRVNDTGAIYDALDLGDSNTVAIDDLTKQLEDSMRGDVALGHILEVFDCVIDVSDIDEASSKLDELFAADYAADSQLLRRIASAHVMNSPASEEASATSLYDKMLEDWIATLPAEIPIAVRQAKERLARRIATEVTLASSRLKPKEEDDLALRPDVLSNKTTSLPILPSKPAHPFPLSLPTPPQSSVPPSSPLFAEYPQPSVSDPLSRLRWHLVINEESPMTPTIIPPSVSELLSHWQPGTDPNTYDWEATERVLQPETPDETSQEMRERERKKKERREKRQRREDELLRAKSQTSSQPGFTQPAFPRSSPGPIFGGMASSSQVPVPMSSQQPIQSQSQGGAFGGFGGVNSMVPQSQVEPGRFGGRPDKKKKKGKSRVSGF